MKIRTIPPPSGSPQKPWRVAVPLSEGRSYEIHIGKGLLQQSGDLLSRTASVGVRRAVIVTQPAIARLWAEPLLEGLRAAGFGETPVVTFPAGERFKTVGTITALYDAVYALTPAVDRRILLIALGGGVVGDMAGYVAATYLRGLDYVQIPTTLLAMVDSSVGGKTGVDFRDGKNLIGAFHQPRAVLIDTDTLATLSAREFRSGMAEVAKYGVIRDPALLREITTGGYAALRKDAEGRIGEIIARCCAIKADVVSRDEFEWTGLRAILNFGHTIGHALESVTKYRRYKHGEAIAIGMVAAAAIGEEQGTTPASVRPAIEAALKALGLPSMLPTDIEPDALIGLLGRDKKARDGVARFVLCEQLGAVGMVEGIAPATIRRGLLRCYGVEKQ